MWVFCFLIFMSHSRTSTYQDLISWVIFTLVLGYLILISAEENYTYIHTGEHENLESLNTDS